MTSRFRMIAVSAVCLSAVAGAPNALAGPPQPTLAPAAAGNGPYTPPACVPGVPFSDVTCTTGFDPWIEQFALDGITSGCGAGKYCPGSPVTRDQMAVFIEKAMRGTAGWPPHTQIVWAVRNADGTPNPTASGTALLNAAAAIPTSGNDVPSASNPWLLKVGPGVYDFGASGLVLPPYVNLDGAGMSSTTLTAANDTWFTVASTGVNTVSNVTVVNSGTANNTYAVSAIGATLTLDHVYVHAWGAQGSAIGIVTNNSEIYVFDGSIVADTFGITTVGGMAYTVRAWRTQFSASYDIANEAGQVIQLAYALVPDGLSNGIGGSFRCIGNYNSSLAPVTCP